MLTATASGASGCAGRSPSDSGCTSLPPKPKTHCSVPCSLTKIAFGGRCKIYRVEGLDALKARRELGSQALCPPLSSLGRIQLETVDEIFRVSADPAGQVPVWCAPDFAIFYQS